MTLKRFWLMAILVALLVILMAPLHIGAYLPGDANQDGVVNMGDVTKELRIIIGYDSFVPEADYDGDGWANMGDVIRIERHIVGLE